ncbi:MAG: DUF192 domain-containing protein [Parcubacteria group bacterium]|nr:DUF192 domain-containing protein [Parcubacteria group bacterium]
MGKYYFIALLVAVFGVVLISTVYSDEFSCGEELPNTTILKLAGAAFFTEVAEAPEERRCGLSLRSHLPKGHTVLFIFEESARHGIWMKDMHFPIDILWLDRDLAVIDYVRNVSPDSYPAVFSPDREAQYVLELNVGTVDRLGITEGTKAFILGGRVSAH